MRKRVVRFFRQCVGFVLIVVLKLNFHLGKNMKNMGSDEDCFSNC